MNSGNQNTNQWYDVCANHDSKVEPIIDEEKMGISREGNAQIVSKGAK